MKEIRLNSGGLFSITETIVPDLRNETTAKYRTLPLTDSDNKKLQEREDTIDAILEESKKDHVWIKLNRGIYKGSILKSLSNSKQKYNNSCWNLHINEVQQDPATTYFPRWQADRKSDRYKYKIADRYLRIYSFAGSQPVSVNGVKFYGSYLSSTDKDHVSLLLDYEGDEVICREEEARPDTFQDRLGQDVAINDLVVVASYNDGLDVCMVKSFAGSNKVILECCETGVSSSINLFDNHTNRIMKMDMSLKDTALMMKLGRE